jgi:small subunit ribosomal protein S16
MTSDASRGKIPNTMLKIKLTPTGKKHVRDFRIGIFEENSKLTGKAKEIIGHFHPLEKKLEFDKVLLEKWLSKGAQPTDRVRRLLKIQ